MRILISNDDGVHARGIRALAEGLTPLGEVWVVAPDRERSATSHAISLHKPLRIRELGPRMYSVDGTPTDCVYMGVHHLMPERPDVVVSGINHGSNLGSDVLYSGTVSAAMEGALLGCRAVAVSLCTDEGDESREIEHFDAAASFARALVEAVVAKPVPRGVLLNVNVPNRPAEALRGHKLCRLGYTDWAHSVVSRNDPRGRPYFWIGGERGNAEALSDSDTHAVRDGYVALTPVHYDLTDTRSFGYVRSLAVVGSEGCSDELGDAPLDYPLPELRQRRGQAS